MAVVSKILLTLAVVVVGAFSAYVMLFSVGLGSSLVQRLQPFGSLIGLLYLAAVVAAVALLWAGRAQWAMGLTAGMVLGALAAAFL